MKITADTNILVRSALRDDPAQANAAMGALQEASSVVVTLQVLCEFAWVLRQTYKFSRSDISLAMKTLLSTAKVSADRAAAEAGLSALQEGADFADGVIAFEGSRRGSEVFVSFDRKATSVLASQGFPTTLLG